MSIKLGKNKGLICWYYDFWTETKRHRGWIGPVKSKAQDGITKREALAEEKRLKANALLNGDTEKEPKNRTLVKQVFDNYEDFLKRHKAATYDRGKYMFKRFKFFHGLDKISPSDIKAFQDKRLKQKVCGITVNREIEYAAAAFNRAKREKLWKGDNPFEGVDKFPEVARTRYLSEDELKGLLKACKEVSNSKSPCLFEIVLAGILTGLRLDKILKLHRDQIDFNLNIITIKATGTNKYMKPNVIPIASELIPILKAQLEGSESGYVFENPNTGQPFNKIRKSFVAAVTKAKIYDFRFHDLRHTFATYALLVSNDLRGVQELMGHGRVTMTEKYAHVLSCRKTKIMDQTNKFVTDVLNRSETLGV